MARRISGESRLKVGARTVRLRLDIGTMIDLEDHLGVGWVCAAALAWAFIGHDLLLWARAAFFPTVPEPPQLAGTDTLVTVLMSMLGLGGLRTVEKIKGVSRETWDK